MTLLAIETSCDETAAAVVADSGDPARPWRVRSNVVASQAEIHRAWGGVVPELASRQHVRDLCGVVERALDDAGAAWAEVEAVAVTEGPGLVGSLLVGVAFAKAAAAALGVPLVPVHHLAGHIESLVVEGGRMPQPAVVLVVSGGHTNLYLWSAEADAEADAAAPARPSGAGADPDAAPGAPADPRFAVDAAYRLIGRTRDDAAGEAYDKVAALLGLEYPGGPVIDRRARDGDDRAVAFPMARMTHDDRNAGPAVTRPLGLAAARAGRQLEFSFSGVKTAVKRHVQQRIAARGGAGPLPDGEIADICASFQRVVVETLLDRTWRAAARFGARSIGIAGGVSANSRLRTAAAARAAASGLPLFLPSLALATDNAAMIGAAGLRRLHAGVTAPLDLRARAALPLGAPVDAPAASGAGPA